MTTTQNEYWDGVATSKTFSHPLQIEWLREFLGPDYAAAVILDYGCGYGRSLSELSEAGFHNSIGADFSAGMLARSHQLVPQAQLIRCDGHTLPFASASIDGVLLFALLTCIPESPVQKQLLAEVFRVLRPGGIVYISDLLINEDERNQARYREFALKFSCYGVFELPEGVVVRHHTKEWIDELVRGFRPEKFEPFEVTTMNGNRSAAFQYVGRKPKPDEHQP
ncbi:MAG TPA: methyltransferase domain-containing protein [Pyrinomonadaceae bacterium]|jgi:ubiquinone/menaquinone biosynthesis C-methylase UbiE|nr:methyltransferase domain-containing protein [Pyrinomonadaceae bacterium]